MKSVDLTSKRAVVSKKSPSLLDKFDDSSSEISMTPKNEYLLNSASSRQSKKRANFKDSRDKYSTGFIDP